MGAFLNPFMLWGMLAVSIPLIIHLLSRRRYKKVSWAAMDFLLKAYQRTRRRLRLENLLLLIVRCLLPLLFALAAARPFLSDDHLLGSLANEGRDVIMIADESYSMQRRAGSSSVIDAQRGQMRKLLSGLDFDGGDALTVMTLADSPRLLSTRLSPVDQHTRQIEGMAQTTSAPADYLETLRYLRDQVVPRIGGTKDVFVFSDLQRSTFIPRDESESLEAQEGEGGPAEVMKSLKNVETRFFLVDVVPGGGAVDNLTVVSLDVLERTLLTNQVSTFVATVTNHGTVRTEGVIGKFSIDGEHAQSVSVEVGPGETTTVEATYVFRDDGFHAVEFTLPEDDLVVDNNRYLSVRVRERIPILLVDGAPDQDLWLSATGQLSLVLDPIAEDAESSVSPFDPEVIDVHQWNRGRFSLDSYELIVLANVAEVDSDVAVRLENYVKSGGGLLIFLGDRVNPASYNDRLYRPDSPSLLPYRLESVAGAPREVASRFYYLEDLQFDHPVLAPFEDPSMTDLLSRAPTAQFYRMAEEEERDGTRVLARWNDSLENQNQGLKSPALIESRLGEGRVVVMSTSSNDRWTLLPATVAGFLPLIHELAYHLTSEDLSFYNLQVGDAMRRSTPSIPRRVALTLPSGEPLLIDRLPETQVEGRYPIDLRDVPVDQVGFYKMEMALSEANSAANEILSEEIYAVNLDPREGDLTRASEDEFASIYGDLFEDRIEDVTDVVSPEAESDRGEIFKSILMALIALCVGETLLAYYFGRRQ